MHVPIGTSYQTFAKKKKHAQPIAIEHARDHERGCKSRIVSQGFYDNENYDFLLHPWLVWTVSELSPQTSDLVRHVVRGIRACLFLHVLLTGRDTAESLSAAYHSERHIAVKLQR